MLAQLQIQSLQKAPQLAERNLPVPIQVSLAEVLEQPKLLIETDCRLGLGSGQQLAQFLHPFQGLLLVVGDEVDGFADKAGMFEDDGEAMVFLQC